MLAAGAGAASATPTISGADTDVWNVANPTPTYTITSASGPVSWAVGGLLGGPLASPAVVKLDTIADDGTYTLVATDNDPDPTANTASRTFRIDRTPPKITLNRPVSGAVYALNASVQADYSCDGGLTCAGNVASGAAIDTSKAGAATFTVKSTDDAGNQAISLVDYTVTSPGNPPATGTTGGPSEPISLVPTPSTTKTPFRPRTLNAKALLPRAGIRIPTRTPLLRWSPRRGATLYNVQIYWLHGTSATKVVSVFPRRHNLRVPAGRVAYGHTYVWRVWPYLRGHYASRPLGLSYFTVKKAPATRTR